MIEGQMGTRRADPLEDMVPLLVRHEIQVLLKAGHSQADVARRTDVSLRTVRRVVADAPVEHVDDQAERQSRRIGRPSKSAPFTERVRKWLAEDDGLPTQELLRRARDAGYRGSKTAFYALVAGVRPPKATPVVRFEGLPGEFSQHDFGQVDITFVDGRKKRVHFFASRLKYSRFVRVTLVENERVETIVRSLARDFAPRPDDGWWLSGASEPSGVSASVPRRVRSGFEVNTSVRVRADDRAGRAQLIRYVARPPFAEAQVEVVDEEQVRFVLRSPSRSGQGELRLHPLALLRRLAWLVPPPRQHQVRAFGVLAPAARLRPKVVPVGRVAVQGRWFGTQRFEPTERVPYREAWARLLSRVYDVDGHACPRCPGRLRPFGAVLPPEAAERVRRSQFVAVESTGPPPRRACRQVCLPFVS
jgi:transposase